MKKKGQVKMLIPEETIKFLREKKAETGISQQRLFENALKFAIKNQKEWS